MCTGEITVQDRANPPRTNRVRTRKPRRIRTGIKSLRKGSHMNIQPPSDGREWHDIISIHEGEDVLSSTGMEIITGSSIEEIKGSPEAQEGALKRGRRLANEGAARVGSHHWLDVLPYLATKAGYDLTDLTARPVYAAKKA